MMTLEPMTSNASTTDASFPTPDPAWIVDEETRIAAAEKIVRKFVLLSLGAGAIPLPVFDIAASVVLQLKLIQELSDLYGVDHREDLARNAISSCLTTIAGKMLGARIGASFAKLFPGPGTKFGIVRTATFFGVSTYISGRILIMHFEAGGSLLNLDPIAMREHFQREYAASQEAVDRIRTGAVYA